MSSSSRRHARSRRTDAVLSDSEAFQPWWRDDALSPMRCSRPKSLRFRSGDPFDRFAALRYLIIAISIITPAVILLTSDFTPGAVHHDWKADPMAEVRRSLLEDRLELLAEMGTEIEALSRLASARLEARDLQAFEMILKEIQSLRVQARRALGDLLLFPAIPADRPTSCRCPADRQQHEAPAWFAAQTLSLRL